MQQHGQQSTQENAKKTCHETVTGPRIEALVAKQEYRCALSGVLLKPADASLDHIIPLCDGGRHVMSNVHVVSKDVNTMKGSMPTEQFIVLCRQVASWNR